MELAKGLHGLYHRSQSGQEAPKTPGPRRLEGGYRQDLRLWSGGQPGSQESRGRREGPVDGRHFCDLQRADQGQYGQRGDRSRQGVSGKRRSNWKAWITWSKGSLAPSKPAASNEGSEFCGKPVYHPDRSGWRRWRYLGCSCSCFRTSPGASGRGAKLGRRLSRRTVLLDVLRRVRQQVLLAKYAFAGRAPDPHRTVYGTYPPGWD